MCLGVGERFETRVEWRAPDATGTGHVVQIDSDRALFSFQSDELLMRLDDDCRA